MKIKSFFIGILAAFFSLITELIIFLVSGQSIAASYYREISWLMALSVIIEEVSKYIFARKNAQNLDLGTRGNLAICGLMIGLGFAATEISFDLWNTATISSSAFPALLGIAAIHALTSVLISLSLFRKRDFSFLTLRIMIFNIFIHLTYNLAVIYLF